MNWEYQRETRVGAFFDLDGTLVEKPSLERQFFANLRARREVSVRAYIAWFAEAVKLAAQGLQAIAHANKKYLRGVRALELEHGKNQVAADSTCPESASCTPVLRFHTQAMERVTWHAKRNHMIFLLSGTLAPLAQAAALALLLRLATRGVTASIGVGSTRLETVNGRWTGRIVGDALFGPAKRTAAERLAAEHGLDLANCYAYGNTMNDRWLLAAVGHPAAVNPGKRLRRLADLYEWPVLWWENAGETEKRRKRPSTLSLQGDAPFRGNAGQLSARN